MGRPLVLDPKTGDRVELPTCDLCGTQAGDDHVTDYDVAAYGSPHHRLVMDLCDPCAFGAWDKAEQHAGDVITRQRDSQPSDVRQRTEHLEAEGKLPPFPPRPRERGDGDVERRTNADEIDRLQRRERKRQGGLT